MLFPEPEGGQWVHFKHNYVRPSEDEASENFEGEDVPSQSGDGGRLRGGVPDGTLEDGKAAETEERA